MELYSSLFPKLRDLIIYQKWVTEPLVASDNGSIGDLSDK